MGFWQHGRCLYLSFNRRLAIPIISTCSLLSTWAFEPGSLLAGFSAWPPGCLPHAVERQRQGCGSIERRAVAGDTLFVQPLDAVTWGMVRPRLWSHEVMAFVGTEKD
jgi:hypothetical protein